MPDTKKQERQRRCLHCACMDDESRMRQIKGAGWLHDPIEGCETALARAADVARRHFSDRLASHDNKGRRGKAFLDADEDAYKLADRD